MKASQILPVSRKIRTATATAYTERVNRAIDYVVGHLDEPLRLTNVSRAAGMSPYHFHRVFHALVGVTLADFAKRLRIERALFMMSGARARRPTLTQIALACGFSSSSDFSRSFRQRFGVAPSAFDIDAWREAHRAALRATVRESSDKLHVKRLPPQANPDRFNVKIRELPPRTVAYIRVPNPYEGDAVVKAVGRLEAWAERNGLADGQWLGYQWDNPEIASLQDCQYHIAVEAEHFSAKGEIGRFRFPAMRVAEIDVRGGVDLELRALQWFFSAWLPRSRYVPDDHPNFEAFIGRPFAHGMQYFELRAHLPIRIG